MKCHKILLVALRHGHKSTVTFRDYYPSDLKFAKFVSRLLNIDFLRFVNLVFHSFALNIKSSDLGFRMGSLRQPHSSVWDVRRWKSCRETADSLDDRRYRRGTWMSHCAQNSAQMRFFSLPSIGFLFHGAKGTTIIFIAFPAAHTRLNCVSKTVVFLSSLINFPLCCQSISKLASRTVRKILFCARCFSHSNWPARLNSNPLHMLKLQLRIQRHTIRRIDEPFPKSTSQSLSHHWAITSLSLSRRYCFIFSDLELPSALLLTGTFSRSSDTRAAGQP